MIRLILVLFFVARSDVGVQSVQYRMHVSKKTETSSAPFKSEYVFNHFDDDPEVFNAIENHNPRGATLEIKPYSGKRSASQYSDGYNMEYRDKIVYASVADKYNDVDTNNRKNRIRDQMKAPKYDYISKQTNVKRMINGKPSSIESSMSKTSKEKYGDKTGVTITDKYDHPKDNDTNHKNYLEPRDYNIAKAQAKYSSFYLPSKIKSDALYERLKSLMHYRPTSEVKTDYSYNPVNDFHVDDDDIRTSSRGPYETWPYFFHTPYEYEHTKVNSDIQKAKDKRFAVDTNHKVIPVHEHHHDMPSYYRPPLTTTHQTTTPDNPISGHQPFFSFVLHDYFDKKVGDDDPLTFKGLHLGEDSYYDSKIHVNDDYGSKRNRRLHEDFPESDYEVLDINYDNSGLDKGESVTERGYKRKHEYDQHEKGNRKNNDERTATEKSHNKYRGFKDFVDAFANKFGTEDHNRKAQYALKKNQDKGEKKKGFHRVYHKDEYQVDNEFYDNNNISSNGEESGNSALRRGGSEGVLQSHAAAALENEANAYNKASSTHENDFENNKSGHEKVVGLNNDFHRYIDVAKKAALSNNADYTDNYK